MAVDDQYTKSLMHFDGNLTDESGKTWTAHGGAATQTNWSKFGGAASELSRTSSQYLSVPNSSDFNLDSNMTIDCWLRLKSIGIEQGIFGQISGEEYNAFFIDSSNNLRFRYRIGATPRDGLCVAWSPSANTDYHVEFEVDGTNIRVFIGGSQVGSTGTLSATPSILTTEWWIGRSAYSASEYANFYMDEFRFSKTARHTSNFTPPTAPYGALSDNQSMSGGL